MTEAIETYTVAISQREANTLLAALRFWQIYHGNGRADLQNIASHNGEPLSNREIDYLCGRINQ